MNRLETLLSSLLVGGMLGACSDNGKGTEGDAATTPDAPRAVDVASEATNDGSVSLDANGGTSSSDDVNVDANSRSDTNVDGNSGDDHGDSHISDDHGDDNITDGTADGDIADSRTGDDRTDGDGTIAWPDGRICRDTTSCPRWLDLPTKWVVTCESPVECPLCMPTSVTPCSTPGLYCTYVGANLNGDCTCTDHPEDATPPGDGPSLAYRCRL
ncbi:MAG TPA: hypothetical protein VK540_14165 [Polyangiaceae bacterium]|nr:hypothetical protein [Polyangiaceae bacterium]